MSLSTKEYYRQRARSLDVRITNVILVCIGIVMPLITLSRHDFIDIVLPLSSRVALVDVIVALLIAALFLTQNLHLLTSIKLYIYALILAAVIGLLYANYYQDPNGTVIVFTEFFALSMALMYWILGYNIGLSQQRLKYLIIGLLVGGLWQGVIVVHDILNPTQQWFPSLAVGIIRGTFRNGAQLSLYGYSLAGIMLTISWSVFSSRLMRSLAVIAGVLGLVFVIAGSRRMIIVSMVVWFCLFLFTGLFTSHRRRIYAWASFFILLTVLLVGLAGEIVAESFVGQRIETGFSVLQSSDNFFMVQFNTIANHFRQWFPVGLGIGRGRIISNYAVYTTDYEIHNAHFALLVETGIIGLSAFYWLMIGPLVKPWRSAFGKNTQTVKAIAIAFVLSAGVAMLHATMHRDRGFLLYIGLLASFILVSSKQEQQSQGQLKTGFTTPQTDESSIAN